MNDNVRCSKKRTVTGVYLAHCLKNNWINETRLFILDCRTHEERQKGRIFGSINIKSLPSILFKRISNGCNKLFGNIILNQSDCENFQQCYKSAMIVLLDSDSGIRNEFTNMLYEKLREFSCNVNYLEGGVAQFLNQYPELCAPVYSEEASLAENVSNSIRLSSLLRISGVFNMKLDDLDCSNAASSASQSDLITSTSSEQPPSGRLNLSTDRVVDFCEHHNSKANLYNCRFPVLIIPNLYLGNAENASDLKTLQKNGIKYIMNVTPDLPNTFENDENFKYMQIPVDDKWSESLTEYFPRAFEFIDEGRRQGVGVLVHCWAGISRSVTVTVAYLMRTLSLSMEDAYDRVKSHKPNIAPNLNFMGQLVDYERDLYGENAPSNQRTPSSTPTSFSGKSDDDSDEKF